MRTSSGNNPHGTIWYDASEKGGDRQGRAWSAHERAAVTTEDVDAFLGLLWRLAAEKKKPTGNSGNLPSSQLCEEARQQARKAGLAEYRTGTGWVLTPRGETRVARGGQ